MLAILYLCVMFALGDAIGRRFFTFVSLAHRGASAFLIGALLSSWWTYALAYLCSNATSPMLWGNILFFITAGGLILWLNQNPQKDPPNTALDVSDAQFQKWDWIIAGVFLLFTAWMMFQTLTISDGTLLIGHHQNADFGSTLSIMQSFAEGHNFPTQYPHFTGERIRYHFLFYFLAADLQYLGFNPTVANNLLSIFSVTAMLILVMTLGGVLFRSRTAGRIGAALFFTHGSLAYVSFLSSQPSFSGLINALNSMTKFLPGLRDPSGVPYRGEDWGVWTLNVYLNQRHLSSAIAIFLLILIYVVIRLREKNELEPETVAELSNEGYDLDDAESSEGEQPLLAENRVDSIAGDEEESEDGTDDEETDDEDLDDEDEYEDEEGEDEDDEAEDEEEFSLGEYIKENSVVVFCGVLLGLLPMWNGAIFLGAGVILAAMIIFFSRFRGQLITLAVTAAIVALPQIIYLKTGHVKPTDYSMLRWGFVIEDAGIFNVLWWTIHTFGFKLALLGIALYFAAGLQRRLLLAVSILLPLTYCFQFSEEILANHKFINLWLVIVNIYCGYAIVKLWHLKASNSVLPSRIAAILLLVLIVIGGLIDLMPIKNSDDSNFYIKYKYHDNKLLNWVKDNTDPKSIFLSDKFINHEILLAGRRLFYGDPYYAWGTDYDTREREKQVKTMLESKDANQVFALLKENNINYIAMDDRLRRGNSIAKNVTEEVFAKYFEVAFSDETSDYGGNMKIYKVPETLQNVPQSSGDGTDQPDQSSNETAAVSVFDGGEGSAPGQFNKPRGLAIDKKGFIYVADYFNARVQKFAPDGKSLLAFGSKGDGAGQFKEPNSIVLDEAGSVYVTDGLAHKLLKFDADGKFIKEWTKPVVDFYGPRDLAFGPNKKLYIIDQGHTNVTILDLSTDTFTTFGTGGAGEGQFNEATGIGIGGDLVFVADRDNRRVQVFDLAGKFIRQWPVEGWERSHYPDVIYDDQTKHIYISDGKSNQILVFDVDGNPLPALISGQPLNNPSAMVISERGKQRSLFIVQTGAAKVSTIELAANTSPKKKGK
ncbi:MAG: 6-bladed beta-propeller [Chloracidobacterium sp.]|nr:6-bladed beta-propeller [Chloracidobacterium sp.]